jgi:hypothetical protein
MMDEDRSGIPVVALGPATAPSAVVIPNAGRTAWGRGTPQIEQIRPANGTVSRQQGSQTP